MVTVLVVLLSINTVLLIGGLGANAAAIGKISLDLVRSEHNRAEDQRHLRTELGLAPDWREQGDHPPPQ